MISKSIRANNFPQFLSRYKDENVEDVDSSSLGEGIFVIYGPFFPFWGKEQLHPPP